jgi:hypothetical protein
VVRKIWRCFSDRKKAVSRDSSCNKTIRRKKIQDAIQEKSDNVLEKKRLGNLNFKVAVTQSEVGSKIIKQLQIG